MSSGVYAAGFVDATEEDVSKTLGSVIFVPLHQYLSSIVILETNRTPIEHKNILVSSTQLKLQRGEFSGEILERERTRSPRENENDF